MKKIALWFLSTLSVVVLLLGYHTSTEGTSVAAAPPAVYSGANDTTSASGTTASATPSAAATPSATATASPSGSASTSASAASTQVTGDTASTQWGPVQVELTVTGGSIEQVDVLQYPSGNGRDEEINSYALPILIKETLAAQSAQIDMVSGATVTSGGYLQSLQSAIDQAGLT